MAQLNPALFELVHTGPEALAMITAQECFAEADTNQVGKSLLPSFELAGEP